MVKAFYKGLNELDVAVVWSIREEFLQGLQLSETDKQKFWLSKWIPQIHVLSIPQVQLFISHCGFGATMEGITTKTPFLCLAQFGDQLTNQKAIVQAGVGEILHEIPPKEMSRSEAYFGSDRFGASEVK